MKTISKKANRKMAFKPFLGFFLLFFCNAYSILYKTAKGQLIDDFYKQKINRKSQKVYINVQDDTLYVYKAQKQNRKWQVDTSMQIDTAFPKFIEVEKSLSLHFNKNSFGIDFLTTPLKSRPSQADLPLQPNTNLNESLYIGYRLDSYIVGYKQNPLHEWGRHIHHFRFSVGIFNGLGNTFIFPNTTQNLIQQEYDGVIWNKGVAFIFAINRLTCRVAIGA